MYFLRKEMGFQHIFEISQHVWRKCSLTQAKFALTQKKKHKPNTQSVWCEAMAVELALVPQPVAGAADAPNQGELLDEWKSVRRFLKLDPRF